MQLTVLVQPHEQMRGVAGDGLKQATVRHTHGKGTKMALHNKGTIRAHCKGGGGRPVVEMASDGMHNTLKDIQSQLTALQEKVVALIRYAAEGCHGPMKLYFGLQPVGPNKDPMDLKRYAGPWPVGPSKRNGLASNGPQPVGVNRGKAKVNAQPVWRMRDGDMALTGGN